MNNIKYLNNNSPNKNTILLSKYFTNFNTENNLNEKIINKLRLNQKISSFIKTIESPKKKAIKKRNENVKITKFIILKQLITKILDYISSLFQKKKLQYSILAIEASKMKT